MALAASKSIYVVFFPSLRSTTDNRFVDIIGHCKTFIVGSILNGL